MIMPGMNLTIMSLDAMGSDTAVEEDRYLDCSYRAADMIANTHGDTK